MSSTATPQTHTPWLQWAKGVNDTLNLSAHVAVLPGKINGALTARADNFLQVRRESRGANWLDLIEANACRGAQLAVTRGLPVAIPVALCFWPLARTSLYASLVPLAVCGAGVRPGKATPSWEGRWLGRVAGGALNFGSLGALSRTFSRAPQPQGNGVAAGGPSAAQPAAAAAPTSWGRVRHGLMATADVAMAAAYLGFKAAQQVVCFYPTALAAALVVGFAAAGATAGALWGVVLGLVDWAVNGSNFTPAALNPHSLYRGPPGTVPQAAPLPRPAHANTAAPGGREATPDAAPAAPQAGAAAAEAAEVPPAGLSTPPRQPSAQAAA